MGLTLPNEIVLKHEISAFRELPQLFDQQFVVPKPLIKPFQLVRWDKEIVIISIFDHCL